jgi:protein SCO1/2
MDPEGKFVDALGRTVSAEEGTTRFMDFIQKWKEAGNEVKPADAKDRILKDESRAVESL